VFGFGPNRNTTMIQGESAVPSPHTPKQNHLLSGLPAVDYARLLPDLELIPMPLGWAAYEPGNEMGYL
jgi:hypothetical protein